LKKNVTFGAQVLSDVPVVPVEIRRTFKTQGAFNIVSIFQFGGKKRAVAPAITTGERRSYVLLSRDLTSKHRAAPGALVSNDKTS